MPIYKTLSFEEICKATLDRDEAQIHSLQHTTLEGIPLLSPLNDPARHFIRINDFSSVEWLIQQGAQIPFLVYETAKFGHIAYTRDLIKRCEHSKRKYFCPFSKKIKSLQLNISNVAYGAVSSDNYKFAYELINKGASITTIAVGVIHRLGNNETPHDLRIFYFSYIKRLISEGANITKIAQTAVTWGLFNLTDQLIAEGANIIDVCTTLHATRVYDSEEKENKRNALIKKKFFQYLSSLSDFNQIDQQAESHTMAAHIIGLNLDTRKRIAEKAKNRILQHNRMYKDPIFRSFSEKELFRVTDPDYHAIYICLSQIMLNFEKPFDSTHSFYSSKLVPEMWLMIFMIATGFTFIQLENIGKFTINTLRPGFFGDVPPLPLITENNEKVCVNCCVVS